LERAREIVEQLAEPVQVAGVHLVVEAAAGLVIGVAGEIDMTELLRRADIATYQAKESHEPVVVYDARHDAASTDRLALLAELREALAARDQLHLFGQPMVELASNRICGVEMFVRWQHPRRGMLLPAQFVPTVEQSDLVGPFTIHIVDLALGAVAQWAKAGESTRVSVNLPARCLNDRDLPGRLSDLLERHAVPAQRLLLEITETVMLDESTVVDTVLAELRRLGIELSADDFGSGFSSLTFLTRVPVNEVKVAKTFVDQLGESAEAAAIVRTTVAMCKELGFRVVAEGVETAEQRARLVSLGCAIGQGFLFYPPMSMDRIAAVLADNRRPPEERTESA
jgi:EAL domain-containing protein (putative c-di-GMP-specific phosphodiesterase class I)